MNREAIPFAWPFAKSPAMGDERYWKKKLREAEREFHATRLADLNEAAQRICASEPG